VPATCTAADLNVHRGRLEGAAGSRFQRVRVTNEGSQACSTPGWTRYRFRNATGAIGFRSTRNPGFDPGAAPVVIDAGATVRSVLSWTNPDVVAPRACHPEHATKVRVRLSGIDGFSTLRMDEAVCTTRRFRPHGTRLGS
jgi:hypothetical protein